MDFRKLTDDLNIISALGDNPNADNALTPSGLKAKFDEAALKIKHYLNEVLIPDLYTAVESEEFRGQPGLSPTVEAERFQDSTGSGVKLVITTPAPPDSGLLDSIISIPLYDGANGVTPKINNIDIEVLEYGADASAEITGPTNNLNLLLKIPRGETGRDGQTPAFRLASAYMLPYGANPEVTISGPTADLRMQLGIPEGAPGPQGEPGKSPKISVGNYSDASGRTGVTLSIENPDSTVPKLVVLYDGKDGEQGPQGERGPSGTPQNLLDNSNFRFAVNQRGQSEYTHSVGTPCIDRWITGYGGGNMTVINGRVTCRGEFEQELSEYARNQLGGKKATAAIRDAYGTFCLASGNFNDGFSNTESGITITVKQGKMAFSIYDGYLYYPQICLYEGEYTAETLPDYQYKGYAAELQECRRYYIAPDAVSIDVETLPEGAAATSSVSGTVDNMRIALGIPHGIDGYTPQRGIDYWTPEDQQTMVADVLAALPVYNGEVEAV